MGILSYILCHNHIDILPFNLEHSLSGASFLLFGYSIKVCGFLSYLREKSKLVLVLLAISFFVTFFSLYYYNSLLYDFSSMSFARLTTFQVDIFCFYAMAITASICVIIICLIINNVNIFNWMGINSMTILIVHVPILELLLCICNITGILKNESLPLYMCLCAFIYVCVFLLCFPCVILFKKIFPQFTGYANLVKINSIK